MATIDEVIVLGASGGFGTLFSQVLSKSGIKVRGISRKGSPRSSSAPLFSVLSPSYPSLPRFPLPFPPILPSLSLPSSPAHTIPPSFLTSGRADACFTDYLSADPCDPKEAVIERVRSASAVISCLPPGPCVRALEALAPHMASGALFTDVLSVKSGICRAYSELKDKYPHVELLSLHPMFAPAAGWHGQNTVSIHIRTGARSKAFEALVETWGSTIVPMESGELHDRVTSAVQNATHAALISFGLTLKKMGYDAGLAKKISTPPHRAMIAVIQRMASINEPDTYWDIQTENPYAASTWQHLQEAVEEVRGAVEEKRRDAFCNIIADFKPLLEAANAEGSCESPY